MDIHTVFPQDLQITDEYEYSFNEFEYEDDDFYHEIREQVLQLTAEEDNFDEENLEIKNHNTVAAKHGLNNVPAQIKRGYYNWPENRDEENSVPAWIVNLWRCGNGTGVFIPQILPSRRRNRSRKKKKGQKRKGKQESGENNDLD
ncbi:protein bassoon [Striga asiatica]|uniref:Protein bassoon n=1 Tax=Striga asiatica TaxID=4170 RepID=A0A5A7P7G6_STRAF|nr:protein bassoon [Striga asiatica]